MQIDSTGSTDPVATAAPARMAGDADRDATGNILHLDDLVTEFRVNGAWHAAVRGVSLTVKRNETLAIVGESGSGKSVTALSVLRLLPQSGARHGGGRILFEGRDLADLSEAQMARVRGNDIAMIFQEPMTSLNPTMRVGDQIAEAVRMHRRMPAREARALALEALREVRIPAADTRIDDYPHQFSGGMRQRVMIAIALACKPRLLLADEPTTALDVTIQAQILALLADLQRTLGMSVVFITHNLGVVAQIADRVAVMYAGEVVEEAPVRELFANPVHPYTLALLQAMPRVDRDTAGLAPIPGHVPGITGMPAGCAFAPRCALRQPSCEQARPALLQVPDAPGHHARCPVRIEQLSGRPTAQVNAPLDARADGQAGAPSAGQHGGNAGEKSPERHDEAAGNAPAGSAENA